jgi:hypothetical protein
LQSDYIGRKTISFEATGSESTSCRKQAELMPTKRVLKITKRQPERNPFGPMNINLG